MARSSTKGGFRPFGPVLSARMYPVATTYGTAIFKGDLVKRVAGGTVEIFDAAGNAPTCIGAVLGVFESVNQKPGIGKTYHVASATGDGTYACYVLVADHPDQLYYVEEDAVGDPLELADRGQNCDYATGTGDTTTGLSGAVIDSSEHNTTATTDLKIIDVYPEDYGEISTTAETSYVRWIVKINAHALADNIAGI